MPSKRTGNKSLDTFAEPDFGEKETQTSGKADTALEGSGLVDESLSGVSDFADEDDELSDVDSGNLTYAGTAFGAFGLAVSAAKAVKVFSDDTEPLERAEALRDVGLGAIGLAEGIGSTVSEAQGEAASAVTKAAESVLGEIASIAGAIKEGWDVVVKIAEAISDHDDLEDAEKAIAGMTIVKSLLMAGKGVIETVEKFMTHLGTVTSGVMSAAPGIGIAINALDMIINGVNIAFSYISMVEMRDDKRASKEKVLGRKANKSKGIRGVFGGHESAETAAVATIASLGDKSTLDEDEGAKLRDAEDYLLSKNLQTIAQKRINRGVLNITANAVNIAGDIATLTGVGAHVGAGLKAGGSGITLGAAAVRTGKQWYHNAKGDSKSERAKLERYDAVINHIVRAILEANAFPVPQVTDSTNPGQASARAAAEQTQQVMRDKAMRQVIASGMTPGRMNKHIPGAQAKLEKLKKKEPTVVVTPETVSKQAGKALYADWVNALKKR